MVGPTLPGAVEAREVDDSDSEVSHKNSEERSHLRLVITVVHIHLRLSTQKRQLSWEPTHPSLRVSSALPYFVFPSAEND